MSSLPNLRNLLDLLNLLNLPDLPDLLSLPDLRSRKHRLNEPAVTRDIMTLIRIQKNGEVSGEDLETWAGN
jgi:hypothetical protein